MSNLMPITYGKVTFDVDSRNPDSTKHYLRVRFPRYVSNKTGVRIMATGLTNTSENVSKVELLCGLIDADLRKANFDETLARYKDFINPIVHIFAGARAKTMDLPELWDRFCQFRKPMVAETTYRREYDRRYRNHVQSLPTVRPEDATLHRSFLLEKTSPLQAMKVLQYLSACCEYAVEREWLSSNQYKGMPESIHIPTIPGESSYIDPFDVAERDAILSAFENHPTHSFYYPYVRFLSLTACRPGEAICLTWGDITKGVTQVRFSRSYDSQLNVSKDTKTHKDRLFPINSTLKELLLDVRPAGASDDKLVFPAKKGGIINHNKFVSQVWKGCEHREKRDYDKKRTGSRVREYKGVLPALIKVGKVERYRPVYNLRHTGITLMVEALIPVNQVAKWVGNSSAVIEQYYLGNIHQFDSPLK